jgi:hypothetical protein
MPRWVAPFYWVSVTCVLTFIGFIWMVARFCMSMRLIYEAHLAPQQQANTLPEPLPVVELVCSGTLAPPSEAVGAEREVSLQAPQRSVETPGR